MSPQSIEKRLEKLEQRVTVLEQLPARIDGLTLQIVQLREEMLAAISASETSLRDEIRAGDDGTRRVLHEEFHRECALLRDEIRANGDRVMNQSRTLYEDMKATLALTEEGAPRTRSKGRPRKF